MGTETGQPVADFGFLQSYFANLLLRRLWSRETSSEERDEILSTFLRPSLRVDPGGPPIVGVGISEWETVGRALEFLSAVETDHLDIESLLRRHHFEGIPWHVTKSGRILASARPAQGGDSIGHYNGDTGTLGCLVVDNVGRKYILSCNHVLAALNKGRRGQDEIWQPGQQDGGGHPDRIGVLDAYSAITMGGATANLIDAALCRPDSVGHVSPGIRRLGNLRGYRDDPPYHVALKKEGARTGVTRGALQMKKLSLRIIYDSGDSAVFDEQLGIIGTKPGGYFAVLAAC